MIDEKRVRCPFKFMNSLSMRGEERKARWDVVKFLEIV